jgi:hypothetical protein
MNSSHFKPGTDAAERGAQGRKRMRELSAEMRSEIAINADAMIRGLGRPATELETLQAEAICALFLRARRLRDQGKDDVAVLREAVLMTSNSSFRHPQDSSPRAPD